MINQQNIEEYILDFIDGELSDTEQSALLDYIEAHPQYKSMIEDYQSTICTPSDTIVYDSSTLLKQPKVQWGKSVKIAAGIGIFIMLSIGFKFWMESKSTVNEEIALANNTIENATTKHNKAESINSPASVNYSNTLQSSSNRSQQVYTSNIVQNNKKPTVYNRSSTHYQNDDTSVINTLVINTIPIHSQWQREDYNLTIKADIIEKNTSEPSYRTVSPLSWLIDEEQMSGVSSMRTSLRELAEKINNEIPSNLVIFDKNIRIKNY